MSTTSAFARAVVFRDPLTGARLHGLRAPLDLPPAADDAVHVWREGDSLEAVASTLLGDPALWWILADVNEITDPFVIAVGTRLRVPSAARAALDVLS
jgi:nucleoid-associated protein YgaU